MRGGWEKAFRLSLLRNDGKGNFTDVTMRERAGNADRLAVSRLGRLRQRRRPRSVRRGEYLPYRPDSGFPAPS